MQIPVDLIILAGGSGSRLGGQDKGLIPIQGRPAVTHLIEHLQLPEDHLIISANRNNEVYERLGAQVVNDEHPGLGPLAGLQAAIPACRHALQLVVPCDMPWLPVSLRQSLVQSASPETISVLDDGERLQPLCMALNASFWRASLSDYLDQGGRSVFGWLDITKFQPCSVTPDHPLSFANINRMEDLPKSP